MMRAVYLDSSAVVKLAIAEAESAALRKYLRRRRPLVSSALARTEVLRPLLPAGKAAVSRGREVLLALDLVRINGQVLEAAGLLLPAEVRSLDAIHLATAELLGDDLDRIVTYDARMASAAKQIGFRITTPS